MLMLRNVDRHVTSSTCHEVLVTVFFRGGGGVWCAGRVCVVLCFFPSCRPGVCF